ncbi:GCN5-like 1 [Pyronema domesticum]|uniref:Biogenesis of lysosome-related organelles complex 1 subunit 1 n=1 Tax=Pyronema omphalodes (strain CBS 100304) TaxID=1076935 RepID=U4KTR7_PYROM|nr:GCN5-like 1 [Pyronema domesticum]CCX04298.1 Similar to Probable biogenesis of lysosome-related organelles complex 1 subunit 1; acc. no. Q22616 [Pyronema omphalodes CBS 100304]
MATARIIKDDALLRKDRYKRADEARAVLTREIHNLGSTVDIELRDRITNIHSNANALDKQSQQLRNKTNQLAKTTKQWGSMADNARGKLKEIGDIQNWAEMIEHDLMVIEETLRIVHDEDDYGAHTASSSTTL